MLEEDLGKAGRLGGLRANSTRCGRGGKEQGVTPKEAASILDSIMSTGKYEETYRVGGTQFKLSRTTVDADRTIEILQEMKPEATEYTGTLSLGLT